MKIYNYNWATGEFLGESEADPSPLAPGKWIIPAYATAKIPPDLEPGQIAIFDRAREDWYADAAPPPPPTPLDEQLAKIPTDNLLGNTTMGDLFNGNR